MSTPGALQRALRMALVRGGSGLLVLACTVALVWGLGALWFQLPGGVVLKVLALLVWTGLAVIALRSSLAPCRRWRGLLPFGATLALLLVWWSGIEPRQDRDWADDVARPLQARLEGERLVIDNVRNFHWRSRDDYDIAWEHREYDLGQVVSADMLLSYWTLPAIAHTLVSFGFEDGRHLVFSLEIRKERDESFSALGGFFRKFEAVLVASDERDIVHVRSNVREEDVYLYRLHGLSRAELRELLRSYVAQGDALRARPAFYNTLTSNCTTVVFDLVRGIAPGLPLDWRLLASGYLAGYAYDIGGLQPGYDLQTLRERGRITARARASGNNDDFSRVIRRGIPGTEQGSP